jgi:hypothetical protein
VTQREKVVNMPVVNKTRHLEHDLTGGHKLPEDQMKKVIAIGNCLEVRLTLIIFHSYKQYRYRYCESGMILFCNGRSGLVDFYSGSRYTVERDVGDILEISNKFL